MRRVSTILLLLPLVLACEGEGPGGPALPELAYLQGHVSVQLQPDTMLAGAHLGWGESETLTDSTGYYFLEVPSGTDTLRVSLDGYVSEHRALSLATGETGTESFALLPVDNLPPLAPLNFAGETLEGASLHLHWTLPEDPDRWAVELSKSPGDPFWQEFDSSIQEWTDSQVVPGRLFTYSLSCRDYAGNRSEALVLELEVDTWPTSSLLSFNMESSFDSIPLSWTDCEDEDFALFRLYRSDSSDFNADSPLLYEGRDTQFPDMDVQSNARYFYRLSTVDSTENTSESNTVTAAAQIFVDGGLNEILNLYSVPGRDFYLSQGSLSGEIRKMSADGEILDVLSPEIGRGNLLVDGNGEKAWLLSRVGEVITLLSLAPLSEQATASLSSLSDDLAELSGGRLVLSMREGGSPLILDAGTLEELASVDILSDLAGGALLRSNPSVDLLHALEPGSRRLRVLDMSGEGELLAELTLDAEASWAGFLPDGSLGIFYNYEERMESRDPESLELLESLILDGEGNFLGVENGLLWFIQVQGYRAYALSFPEGETLWDLDLMAPALSLAYVTASGRLALAMSTTHTAICDVSRGDE
ncbi:MAG: carboxypeptidase-like regulatory domain-containing protein [Candidatus Krumholzibacteria bacterium]|jgi:hypothetical protein|nr:carboxypeptidase-like regulatory domain-containing protein [Candidatus Krumholzibacteria bacterium]MDP6668292.1 carboxypeptidase-like regulatory domain-containing protein [Candidatus Krumholzibacteria bacterium]MDP6797059.1 carboxypeptidase-like regulatory domain-containing protein [Candidatus Krumholzibacteria bacterium]MDP7022096.1 carboxypeptidase-like regulatory domain-containing protein [Candidatus Krumholzibacteria bacterium]